jgi:hypothetical protein
MRVPENGAACQHQPTDPEHRAMVTVAVSAYIQVQGTLVRQESDHAFVNSGGKLIFGKLLTQVAQGTRQP